MYYIIGNILKNLNKNNALPICGQIIFEYWRLASIYIIGTFSVITHLAITT